MTNVYKSDLGKSRIEEGYRSFLDMWPVPAEHLRVPTREGETFVVACGPETAPPLVLLHGSMANATTWLGEIAVYAAHFRCYAVDIIGEPGFSAPSRPDLNSNAYVLWLEDVLAGLKLERANFLALSLGGLFTFQFGAARPDRIIALAGNAPAGICRSRNIFVRYLPFFFMGEWGKARIRKAILGDIPTELSANEQAFFDYFDLINQHVNPRLDPLPRLSDAEIKALGFPVFVIVGGKDVLLHTEDTRDRLRALAPNATVDFRTGARHYVRQTERQILPFLLDVNGLKP